MANMYEGNQIRTATQEVMGRRPAAEKAASDNTSLREMLVSLHQKADEIAKELCILGECLSPVLLPAPPDSPQVARDEVTVLSPLQYECRNLLQRLDTIRGCIADLRQRAGI